MIGPKRPQPPYGRPKGRRTRALGTLSGDPIAALDQIGAALCDLDRERAELLRRLRELMEGRDA